MLVFKGVFSLPLPLVVRTLTTAEGEFFYSISLAVAVLRIPDLMLMVAVQGW